MRYLGLMLSIMIVAGTGLLLLQDGLQADTLTIRVTHESTLS